MRPNYKPNFSNRPKHLKQNNSFYFLTVKTLNGQWFLRPDKYKQIVLDCLKEKAKKFEYQLIAYIILANHYHLIVKVYNADKLARFMAEINGTSARALNLIDGAKERKVWWNYYDHVLRDEADFFKHLNYIHQNSVKHGISKDLDYPFSSYNAWVKQKGKEYLNDAFAKYPVKDFLMYEDDL